MALECAPTPGGHRWSAATAAGKGRPLPRPDETATAFQGDGRQNEPGSPVLDGCPDDRRPGDRHPWHPRSAHPIARDCANRDTLRYPFLSLRGRTANVRLNGLVRTPHMGLAITPWIVEIRRFGRGRNRSPLPPCAGTVR